MIRTEFYNLNDLFPKPDEKQRIKARGNGLIGLIKPGGYGVLILIQPRGYCLLTLHTPEALVC